MSKNITLALADETFLKMRQFSEIRWSEVARKAIEEKVALLEELNAIASKSRLSTSDARAMARKIKRGVARRHGIPA